MTADHPGKAPRRAGATPAERRRLLLGGLVVGLLGLGWFFLSHLVIGTATSDAIGEALGVVLALLVLASVVGAIRSTKGDHG